MKLRLWVDIAEITASLAVVATLGLLVVQISQSNELEKRQSVLRQAQWDAQLFLLSDDLPNILAKIKAVDGYDMQPFMEKYDLSYAEAASWNRWLVLMWRGMELDYMTLGPSEQFEQAIRTTVAWPDQQLFVQGAFFSGSPFFSTKFTDYVLSSIEEIP
jgi:hypothetical protein